ncbi:MAG: hypothetical protein IJ247_06150 [Bacilli bacterium]|nr:hypothetical protein [Bacilli bacterium]
MKKRKILLFGACSAVCLGVAAFAASSTPFLGRLLNADGNGGVWHHYSAQNSTPVEFGTKEYWVQCGGGYQFTAPEGVTIIDKEGAPDTSGFVENDDRWNQTLADYNLGGGTDADLVGAYFTNGDVTYDKVSSHFLSGTDVGYTHTILEYNPYDTFTWELGLPRFNFAVRNTLMKISFKTINWAGQGRYALTEAGLEDDYVVDNGITGQIYAKLVDGVLKVSFVSGGNILTKSITDSDVINGKASITLYARNNSNGNAYFGVTAIDANCDESELIVGKNLVEATATVTGSRQDVNILTGENVGEPYDYYLEVGYLWFNDCSSWCGRFIVQLSIDQGFAAGTHLKPADGSNIYLVRGETTYTYDLSRYSKDLMSYDSGNKQFTFNDDWFKYGVFGTTSWNGDPGLEDGDVLYFQGTFVAVDNSGSPIGGGFTMKKTGVRFEYKDSKYYETAFHD